MLFRNFAVSALLLSLPLTVSGIDSGCLSGGYVGLEALYWTPSMCPIPFAQGRNTRTIGALTAFDNVDFNVDGVDDWGVRAFIGYNCECVFADLNYHWFESVQKRTVLRGNFNTLEMIGSEAGNYDEIRTNLTTTYNNLSLRLGAMVYADVCKFFSIYADFRYVDIELKNFNKGRLVGQTTFQDSFDQRTEFDGGGIGIGVSGRHEIACGFGLTARASALALIGDTSMGPVRVVDTNDSEINAITEHSMAQTSPSVDVRVALTYAYDCRSATIQGQIGYELDYYWRALRYSDTDETTNGIPVLRCHDIGFGGLFFGVTVAF